MSMNALVRELEDPREAEAPPRPPVAEWLLAMGPVVHRLDYGGRVAALGCVDARSAVLLASAYPLATFDAVDDDARAVDEVRDALCRAGAQARCDVEVGGPERLAPGTYDLVCILHGLTGRPDPVASARTALRALQPTGALMVVEHVRSNAFSGGPVTVGAWLLEAGAARVRLAAATPHGFMLDARPSN